MEKDFYHHVCHACRSVPEPVAGVYQKFKSCSGCKLISYCSVSHQRADWPSHKSVCRHIKRMTESYLCPTLFDLTHSPQSLYQAQNEAILLLEQSLNRPLRLDERSSIFFPDICGLCLRPNGKAYIFCSRCQVQFYCSDEHKNIHSAIHEKDCQSLKLGFQVFKDRNLETMPGRADIKKSVNSGMKFPASLDDYLSTCLDVDSLSLADRIGLTDVLSYVMTLVYAVRESNVLTVDKSSLCVHIIGANVVESNMLVILEHFFLWLDTVRVLDLVFVGPDCLQPDSDLVEYAMLKFRNRLSVKFHERVLYHDMMKALPQTARKPDLIVAFNCGFHEYEGLETDTWLPTIEYILTNLSTILVCTAYTPLEAENDSKPFVKRNPQVRTIKFCERNPFRSLMPYRNPERTESSVFFFNQMLSIFSIEQDIPQ